MCISIAHNATFLQTSVFAGSSQIQYLSDLDKSARLTSSRYLDLLLIVCLSNSTKITTNTESDSTKLQILRRQCCLHLSTFDFSIETSSPVLKLTCVCFSAPVDQNLVLAHYSLWRQNKMTTLSKFSKW